MSRANLKLTVAFEFDLEAPPAFVEASHEQLCRALQDLLGSMVMQGMPTITAKQLAKAGIAIHSHHHHLDVVNMTAAPIARDDLIAAGPHLTDAELDTLARRAAGRVPLQSPVRERYLRRQALALVGDFRTVPCKVLAKLLSGKEASLSGRLNLTNGSVVLGEQDRQSRLQAKDAPIAVEVGPNARLAATCAGHTLSGPVIEVALPALAGQRDALIGIWVGAQSAAD